MKKEYNIKDKVWIHMGERKLVEGRVVEIIDLAHLNENHDPDRELYVIEIHTGIDDIYEVRDFEQISPDEKGPINLFRKHKSEVPQIKRYLKKVGVSIPVDDPDPIQEFFEEVNEEFEEPTPEQIHAAMDRYEAEKQAHKRPTIPSTNPVKKPRKRFYKKKKSDA